MRFAVCLVLVVGALAAAACGPGPTLKPEAAQVAPGVKVEGTAVGGLSRPELASILQQLAARYYTPPVNARFADAGGAILPEAPGRLLDVTATVDAALAAPADSELAAVHRPLAPAVTVASLAAARVVGSYTTPILDASPGRLENIRLTAALINNAVIGPGEEFSFNRRTGEPTPERGFQPATVLVDGRREQGLGGGMCQVSSTLYNTVLAAGLPVVERHPHSQPVSYVPPERDATTYTDKDFRFVNSTRGTLVLRAGVAGKILAVDIFALPHGGE